MCLHTKGTGCTEYKMPTCFKSRRECNVMQNVINFALKNSWLSQILLRFGLSFKDICDLQ